MNKIAIITICDFNNYGNRLQNFAVQSILSKEGFEVFTIKNKEIINNDKGVSENILRYLKSLFLSFGLKEKGRKNYFKNFNRHINFDKRNFNWFFKNYWQKYDYFVVGSDQVWNPKFGRLSDLDLLTFVKEKNKKISVSASFGIDNLTKENSDKVKLNLESFKSISVREESGKKIIENLNINNMVEVLIDPTMMIDNYEWSELAQRPIQLKSKKYILMYFLGNITAQIQSEIDRIAKEKNCEIINVLDKKSEFYKTGPSEFLYLEKNAFLICTDSFHSAVFAILFNVPFCIFKRKGSNIVINSRIDTLLSKFKLQDRYCDLKITDKLIECNYTKTNEILSEERKKFMFFLEKALDIKEN